MDTIIFGDSLAGNYGIAPQRAWSQLLADQRDLTIRHVIHRNGYTSVQLLECLGRDVLSHRPQQILLICGSNDALRGRKAEAVLDTVALMIQSAAERGSRMIWLLPPQMDAPAAAQWFGDPITIFDNANQTLARIRVLAADRDFQIVDLEPIRQAYLTIDPQVYTDGLHFNEKFQHYLAEAIQKELFSAEA